MSGQKGDHGDLLDILSHVDPALLDYQEWCDVGMALKASGFRWEDWDRWSAADPRPGKYKSGECRRKWSGFNGEGVTSGTIVALARRQGWEPRRREHRRLDPFGTFTVDFWEPGQPVPEEAKNATGFDFDAPASTWGDNERRRELKSYLEAVFDPDDLVAYVTNPTDDDKPADVGCFRRTRSEIVAAIDSGAPWKSIVFGDPKERAGAWVRPNPVDGKGVGNANVTAFRHALVESDDLPPDQQLQLVRDLRLPCSAVVSSGGKSVHAVVRVDAPDRAEYDRRVSFLYGFCERHGLKPDRQNKNPSRLSRMPGFKRKGKRQALVECDPDPMPWDKWEEWAIAEDDGLPDIDCLADVMDDLPPLAPEVIKGVLRRGHKMLLAGPSKASKSFALMELAVSVAYGVPWLGMEVAKGKALYVNLEIDSASAYHRFRDIVVAMGLDPHDEWLRSIDVWSLRGHSQTMEKLAPRVVNKCGKRGYDMVIIDPIYKVMEGDENSAGDMARFCNQFDLIATRLGCSVVFAHHHSKSAQNYTSAMNRASGSGVFARDPDALLDMSQLQVEQEDYDSLALDDFKRWALREMPREVAASGCSELDPAAFALRFRESLAIEDKARADTARAMTHDAVMRERPRAFVIEQTLREFAEPRPLRVWFRYPVHVPDGAGLLKGAKRAGTGQRREGPDAEKGGTKTKRLQDEKNAALRCAVAECEADGVPATRQNVLERIGEVGGKAVTADALRAWTRPDKSDWCDFKAAEDGSTVLVARNS